MTTKLDLLGDSWRRQVIGARFDARMNRLLIEANIRRVLEEGKDRRRGILEAVHVARLDPRTRRVKEIGFNLSTDLILDNFGYWLASIWNTPGSSPTFNLVDTTNTTRTFYTYHGSPWNQASVHGTRMQLGSSSTVPGRGDYSIGTALPTAPESGVFGSGAGSYASAAVSFSAGVTAGGSGTVRESGAFGYWYDTGAAVRTCMLFHDLISPVVPYVAGNVLTCAYSITL